MVFDCGHLVCQKCAVEGSSEGPPRCAYCDSPMPPPSGPVKPTIPLDESAVRATEEALAASINLQLDGERIDGKYPIVKPKRFSELVDDLRAGRPLPLGHLLELITHVTEHFEAMPNVIRINGRGKRVVIVGDLHGHFEDLLRILRIGLPWDHPDLIYLFLGDYVDRGDNSCQILSLLYTMVMQSPDQVFLLRGNHESREMAANEGFETECTKKCSILPFLRHAKCFQSMPIFCVVEFANRNVGCCHGGIPKGIATLDELNLCFRFREPSPGDTSGLTDTLWNDPENAVTKAAYCARTGKTPEQFESSQFVENKERNIAHIFTLPAADTFLRKNGLKMLVRAHEYSDDGIESFTLPKPAGCTDTTVMASVFSTSGYKSGGVMNENDAAYVVMTDEDNTWRSLPFGTGTKLTYREYDKVDILTHISSSFPALFTSCKDFCSCVKLVAVNRVSFVSPVGLFVLNICHFLTTTYTLHRCGRVRRSRRSSLMGAAGSP